MGNQVDGRFDRRSSVNWQWKNDPHLIGDHLPILIGDQADWSLIGGEKPDLSAIAAIVLFITGNS